VQIEATRRDRFCRLSDPCHEEWIVDTCLGSRAASKQPKCQSDRFISVIGTASVSANRRLVCKVRFRPRSPYGYVVTVRTREDLKRTCDVEKPETGRRADNHDFPYCDHSTKRILATCPELLHFACGAKAQACRTLELHERDGKSSDHHETQHGIEFRHEAGHEGLMDVLREYPEIPRTCKTIKAVNR